MMSLMRPPPSSSPTEPEHKSIKRGPYELGASPPPKPKRRQQIPMSAKATLKTATNPKKAAKALAKAAITAPDGQTQARAPHQATPTWQTVTDTTVSMWPLPHQNSNQWPPHAWHDASGFLAPQQMPWTTAGPPPTFAMPTSLPPQPQASPYVHEVSPWMGQQNPEYSVPSLPTTYVGYPAQPPQTSSVGSASHPIVLDDLPTTVAVHPLTPAVATNPQPPYVPNYVTEHISSFYDERTNTVPSNFVAYPTWPTAQKDSSKQAIHSNNGENLAIGDPQHLIPTQHMAHGNGAATPLPTSAIQGKLQAPSDEPVLCPEQAALVDLILKGNNVFYTGSAGCGKSTVLKAFVKQLRDMGRTVRIVAPTGRAALNVGGSTTWTFAGFTPDSHKLPLDKLRTKAMFGTVSRDRLKNTDVLVIDEVSMVENLHFERLNEVMKAARHDPHTKPKPFGGCQIVVTGDFCQLPPVKPFQHCIKCGKDLIQKTMPGGKLVYECRSDGVYADEDKWAFKSKAWEECDFVHVHLKTIHRQNDQTFIRMLQKCRLGESLEDSEVQLLLNHKCRVAQATKLFCTKREAEAVNQAAFNKLVGITHPYWAHDRLILQPTHQHLSSRGQRAHWRNTWGAPPPSEKLPLKCFDEHRFGECVQLKNGMLVVLLANIDLAAGLCNGSQGTVCGFEDYDPEKMPVRELRESFSGKGSKDWVPVKSGQRALRGEHAALMEHEIKQFITSESAPIKKWPIVRFHNGVKRTVYAECSVAQLGDEEPYSIISRTQIPLAPAWAMTVHKSQSLTLDRVIVNLDRAFEEGQVYVALSRATGLEGLKIEGDGSFLRDKLMVNPDVAAFLKEKFGDIYKATEAENAEPQSL